MEKLIFNKELIRKYDVQGPRYTSYPTAAQFAPFEIEKYYESVRDSNEHILPTPLSVYIHIPFCDTICYYCACNKIVTADKTQSIDYINHLVREFELKAPLFDRDREVLQMHFGGGTPTFLSDAQIAGVIKSLGHNYSLSTTQERDFSIEIDPRTIDLERLKNIKNIGFNRLSFGVQDFNHKVQQAVNRIQSEQSTRQLITRARELDFKSISVDLIYGLPFQNEETFRETVDKIIEMRPDRLSIFNYAHLPIRFKPQRRIALEDLPSAELKLKIYEQTIQQLNEAGYLLIGMDHFALEDDELSIAQKANRLHRNFQGYTTHAECDLVSFGISAISMLDDCYVQNATDKLEYYKMLDRNQLPISKGIVLSHDNRLRRDIIMQLLCHFSLSKQCIEQRFNINFDDYFKAELTALKDMQQDGLLVMDAHKIEITHEGRLLARSICMVFDRFLAHDKKALYSRVI